jgi:hypothetical protein
MEDKCSVEQLAVWAGILVVNYRRKVRLPGVEPGSIAWKAIILTVGLQTLGCVAIIV